MRKHTEGSAALSRRDFLHSTAMAGAGLAVGTASPHRLRGRDGRSLDAHHQPEQD